MKTFVNERVVILLFSSSPFIRQLLWALAHELLTFLRPLHNLGLTDLIWKTIGIQTKSPKFTI